MDGIKVAVAGAAGRMGRALVSAISQADDLSLIAGIEYEGSDCIGKDAGQLAGIDPNGVAIAADISAAVKIADVVIDFTNPQTSLQISRSAVEHCCAHVIGTTGFDSNEEQSIASASESIAIVKSGNMSLGVNLLSVLTEQAARALEETQFDIEIVEMHHRRKVDAPSGTALMLGQAAASGRGIGLEDNSVRTRDGITGPRTVGDIGFATLRGGSVVGEHSVIFAGNGERIELAHIAQDRSLFANGALQAVRWINGKPAGLYSMRDVLNLNLD